jgi:hypothetical protein
LDKLLGIAAVTRIKPMKQPLCQRHLHPIGNTFVNFVMVAGAIVFCNSPVTAQTPCKGTLKAAFETKSYQLTVCQDNDTLFLLTQQKAGNRQTLRMPAFYNPETQVFGGVRTIPNPGAAYAYDLNPAITTVYYIQDKRLYVLQNGVLVTNEAISR